MMDRTAVNGLMVLGVSTIKNARLVVHGATHLAAAMACNNPLVVVSNAAK
jgi:hypothetical protein